MKNPVNKFNFDSRKCKPQYGLMVTPQTSLEENKKIMLMGLRYFCTCCRMCPIGCSLIEDKKGNKHDPHVMSNMMFDAKYMIVGQNPGMNECKFGIPFIGDAGKNFDEELKKNELDRTSFYITNVVHCFTKNSDGTNNRKPNTKEKETCSSMFLINEIKIINPKLIITLGASAFSFFCPDHQYSDCLGKITKSNYGKIYAIYHPSPMNINDPARRQKFNRQVELLAKLIKKIE